MVTAIVTYMHSKLQKYECRGVISDILILQERSVAWTTELSKLPLVDTAKFEYLKPRDLPGTRDY